MSRIVAETLLNVLFPSWWAAKLNDWHKRRWYRALQRRQNEKLLRDGVAKIEIAVMREVIADAETAAARGAVISTARHAAKDGLSRDAALVILQWFVMTRP